MDKIQAVKQQITVPKVISQRGKNQLEIERENFERAQHLSLNKAISTQENPVKEKHVRIAIIGTHQEKGCNMFWHVVTKMPLQGHPIVAWKFCHVLHKVLREGHSDVLKESIKYSGYIKDLGKLWGHLREGYGKLISFYTKLLVQKLAFHRQNPDFPGNMNLEEGQLDKICGNDINNYFELSVDMLDYMDDILGLQAAVFGSLDMSRSNSMTSSGQCRLAPLILCILDSCQLYDYTVKLLFKLHASLPPDTLSGHRQRFFEEYKKLKQFYHSSANLQYFKNLIKVPSLPDSPPNFLQAADLYSHVTPVAIVPEPEPEPLGAQTPDNESVVDFLVDTSAPEEAQARYLDEMAELQNMNQNGAPSPPMPDERDRFIEQLMREINELKEELARVKAEDQMIIESLRNRLKEVEMELNEYKQIAESTGQENECLKNVLQETEQTAQNVEQLNAVEKLAKVNEEKFKKMKDIYTKLREEHVQLLRTNAEVKKKFTTAEQSIQELTAKKQSLSQELVEVKLEKGKMEASLQQSSAESDAKLVAAVSVQSQVENEKKVKDMEKMLSVQTKSIEDLEKTVQELEATKSMLESSLQQSQSGLVDMDEKLKTSETALTELQKQLEELQKKKDALEATLKQQQIDATKRLLASAVEEGEVIIQDSLDQCDNPAHSTVTCSADYLISRTEPALEAVRKLQEAYKKYSVDSNEVSSAIKCVSEYSHRMADIVIHGKATANSAPIEPGEALTSLCKNTGDQSLSLLRVIKEEKSDEIDEKAKQVTESIRKILTQAEELMPKVEDVKVEQIGDLVDQEMQETTNAIEQAAAKIAAMLAESREAHSGIQLEVNEGILESCTGLMLAIKVLIEKSKNLQREIVAQGRGSSSSKDFYKKHHRWTEGLISAAKAVGWGANVLVESADKVVKGEGKFEQLIVCSQEIAASTTQLVVSSKVKAERNSPKLGELSEASKHVGEATGKVVASAKSGAQMIEDLDTLDFSKITLHQAKRQEMDSQVRVLELESELQKERVKLAELRKKHYQLAGESEGWDQEDLDALESREAQA